MSNLGLAQEIAAGVAMIGQQAGQAVRVRRYTGASGGAKSFAGQGPTRTYTETPVQLSSLRIASTRDIEASGGRIKAGDLLARAPWRFGAQDRIVVDGAEYEVSGEPQAETLIGPQFYSVTLRRSGD